LTGNRAVASFATSRSHASRGVTIARNRINEQKFPQSNVRNPPIIWLVRHVACPANVARRRRNRELPTIDFPQTEAEVPLSLDGEKNRRGIGNWFASTEKPTVVFSSPYKRARETAQIVLRTARFD